jgi:5-methylcytosine-specific restriction endonuclease McrA
MKQRKTKNLGTNQADKHELVYSKLISLGITTKKCSRSTDKPHENSNFVHEGDNPLSIREFNLQTSSKDGLQTNCRNCERKYRSSRTNKNKEFYEKMTKKEIYANYKIKYSIDKKVCGRCNIEKVPEEFPLSKSMESGLHNQCYECNTNYRESISERWIRFCPDGHTVNKPNDAEKCVECKSQENLQFDHKWPISKGGTDNVENIKVLCKKCNQKKKVDVSEFKSINDVHSKHICKRYHSILEIGKKNKISIIEFESQISAKVKNYLDWKCNLSDIDLIEHYKEQKIINNRKHNIERAAEKFKGYCLRNSFKNVDKT